MTKLLVQGDDFGFTKGVVAGIEDAIENGVLRNTGLFANMPSAVKAVEFMPSHPEVCFGIDFNLVAGRPCSDPKDIPHLVDEDGNFIRSGVRVRDPRWQSEEGRNEMFPYEEVEHEIRAQYNRFLELTGGKKPGYLHEHSISYENYVKAIRTLAEETGIPYSTDTWKKYHFINNFEMGLADDKASSKKIFDPNDQLNKRPLKVIQDNQKEFLNSEYAMIIGHPGFVDADLMDLTTLSLERMRDNQMMTSPWLKNWIQENQIELITYRDLK